MARVALVMLALGLSACVATPTPEAPGDDTPEVTIVMAPATVVVDGREYIGSVEAGPPGMVITPVDAEPVYGSSVRVSRPGLLDSDGIEAKAAAAVTCIEAAGGDYDPGALGRFVPVAGGEGAWVFDGACQ